MSTRSTCPVCGKYHQRWAGSTLDRHARCLGTPDLHDDVLYLKELFPQATLWRIAADLGVTQGIVRVWLRDALERRAARRRAG
jgi:hypothetical protein